MLEGVPLDNIDPQLARDGYKRYQDELAKANTAEDKATAMIGVEVHQAMCAALGVAP